MKKTWYFLFFLVVFILPILSVFYQLYHDYKYQADLQEERLVNNFLFSYSEQLNQRLQGFLSQEKFLVNQLSSKHYRQYISTIKYVDFFLEYLPNLEKFSSGGKVPSELKEFVDKNYNRIVYTLNNFDYFFAPYQDSRFIVVFQKQEDANPVYYILILDMNVFLDENIGVSPLSFLSYFIVLDGKRKYFPYSEKENILQVFMELGKEKNTSFKKNIESLNFWDNQILDTENGLQFRFYHHLFLFTSSLKAKIVGVVRIKEKGFYTFLQKYKFLWEATILVFILALVFLFYLMKGIERRNQRQWQLVKEVFLELETRPYRALIENKEAMPEEVYEILKSFFLKLKSLEDFVEISGHFMDIDSLFNAIVRKIEEILVVRRVSAALWDSQTKTYRLKVASGFNPKFKDVKEDSPILTHILSTGKGILVKDIGKDERFKEYKSDDYTTSSFIAVPIFMEGKIEGILFVTEKEKGELTENDLQLLEIFSRYLGIALYNHRLFLKRINLLKKEEKRLFFENVASKVLLSYPVPYDDGKVFFNFLVKNSGFFGGDFFFIQKFSENCFLFFLVDASGNEADALFNSLQLKSVIEMKLELLENKDNFDFRGFLKEVNQSVKKKISESSFFSLLAGMVDYELKKVTLANFGYPPPFIFDTNSGKLKSFNLKSNLMFGMFSYENIEIEEMILLDTHILFAYSDGLLKTTNYMGEKYDFRRIEYLWETLETKDIVKFFELTGDDISAFLGYKQQEDDISIAILTFKNEVDT